VARYIAIDLDSQGVFVVAGSLRGGTAKVDHALAWDGSDGEPVPALTAETARQLGERLRDRLKAAGVSAAPVLVAVGRDRVVLKEVKYPAVPPAEEPNVVRFQALKEISDSPDDIVLDYTPMAAAAPDGEQQSMALVIRKDLYSAIQTLCEAANLRLAAVTPRPYAVAAGLLQAMATGAAPAPEDRTEAVAALTLSPGGGEFTVLRNGMVTFTVAVPAPVVASEPMLLAQLRRNLTVYAGSNPAHPVQALYVAEAGGWAGRFRAALGLPVHAYDPLTGAVPAVPEPLRGRFAGAVGLLAAKATDTLAINFASPRQPKAPVDPKRNQLMLAVLAALVLLAVGGVVGYLQLSAADAELAQLAARKRALEDDLTRLEPDAKRLAAARQWQSRRVVWLDELFDMADRFPGKTEGFYAISFHGQSLPPDQKTGKQENQGEMTVKIAARDGSVVDSLLHAMEADNVNPKKKHYVGWLKAIGSAVQGDAQAREITIRGRVNNRSPDEFTRQPTFTPPSRKNYPPAVTPTAPKEVSEPEKTEPAPSPTEKTNPEN
jgi:Tfp pilus assembly PilM family ATPase